MAKYGLDLYGESYYGRDVLVSYSVGEVVAAQTDYGSITLTWSTPANLQNWGVLRIVRNTAGYPTSEVDGDIIVEFKPDAPRNSCTDADLVGGRFYYYSVFLSSAFPPYDSTDNYQAGDTVSYGGNNWMCTADNTLNVTPSTSAPQWQATNATALWNRAGQACTLAVADYGYRQRLYDLLPTPYATAQEEVSAPQDPTNDVLRRYLAVLGWALDITRTELGDQESLHRVETMPLSRLELLANQLGVDTEASITPRLRRVRVARAAQLAKRNGTIEAIKEAIYDATGYDSTIDPSTNLMLDADQAESYSPIFPVWDPAATYTVDTVVSYGGYLYKASSNTIRLETENLTLALDGAASSTIQGNTTTATYSNNRQVLVRSNAVGQAATFTFAIPSTGTYDLSIGVSRSFDYGIVNFAVDGVSVFGGQTAYRYPPSSTKLAFDGYSRSSAPATSQYLGRFSLTAGNHTIKLTVAGKNAKSGTTTSSQNGGYQIGADYITYTPQGASSGVGIAPTGSPTSNAFWTYYTGQLTNVLDNPLTGGVSTWEQVSSTVGATASNDSLDVYSGHKALSGTGDNRANLTVMTNGTGVTATLAAHSIPRAKVTAWSATTTYPRGSYVSYAGTNYMAILPTVGDVPDADRTHWQPEVISTTTTDRFLASAFGIPLAQDRRWSAGDQYVTGDLVQYQGNVYLATRNSKGKAPSGSLTDTDSWVWARSAQNAYSASAYTSRYSGTGTPTRNLYIEWFDAAGNLITTINPSLVGTNPDLFVPFMRNSSNVSTDPSYLADTAGLVWKLNGTDVPAATSSMVYWATRVSNVNTTGRHLYFTYDRGDQVCAGVTFMTAPPTGVEQALAFRRSGPTDLWTASRTRLAKMVAGTLTTVASWSSLPNGSRIYVQLTGSAIKVFRYVSPGTAPVQLASVTDTFNSTATDFGLIERLY